MRRTEFQFAHTVYLLDFGLAREIFVQDENGATVLREPRRRVRTLSQN